MNNPELAVYDYCPFCQRTRIAAELSGKPVTILHLKQGEEFPEWFKIASPESIAPMIRVDGSAFGESLVICEFFNDYSGGQLMPATALDRALVRGAFRHADRCQMALGQLFRATDAAAFDKARDELGQQLARIGEMIAPQGRWFATPNPSLPEALFAPVIWPVMLLKQRAILDLPSSERLAAWFNAVNTLPAVDNACNGDRESTLRSTVSRLAAQGELAQRLGWASR
jgi:glutathione S-transferase